MRVLASIALLAGLCLAQTKVASVEGITEYDLDNGLKVLLFPDKTKPTVTVNVTYMVGSRLEGYGETGMAHLLEHMLFKGTTTRGDIKAELASHGAEPWNGTTSYDRTNYFETLQATDANLRWAIEMEADRMVNSRVAKSDLDTEMTVVRSEFEMGENSPVRVLYERVLSTAYLWHSYGKSTIGARSDIEHVPIENLQAFYRKYYQPDNAMLVVAGNFDDAKTLGWIKASFGAIPRPTRKLAPTWTDEPTQDGEREVVLRRTGDFQELIAAYHIPAGSHPDAAALEVLQEILATPPSGRLYKALVESKKAVSVGGDTFQLHDPGVALYMSQVRKEASLDDVEKTMLNIIDEIQKEPPSKDEVERARAHLLKEIDLSMNNSSEVGVFLSEWQSMGDWRLMFLDRDRIKSVTPDDVARVAKIYLKSSNRTIGRFIPEAKPERAEIPATPDVASVVKDYKGGASVEQGEAFDPTPANIDARTIRVTLPNGMKLALLPKKTRGATVHAVIALHYGDEKSMFGKDQIAQVTAAMLMRGTKNHTRQQIQDQLDKLKAQMNASGSALNGTSVSISTIHSGLADTLRLAAEVLRDPVFPESEFEQIRQSSLGRIEAQRNEPQAIASLTLNRMLTPYPAGDPRATLSIDESLDGIKKLTLDQVKKFHADFYGASNAELAIVGDFDAGEMQKLATELFGNWKSPAPYTQIQRSWHKLDAVTQTIETPDKANSMLAAGISMQMKETDPDFPAMLLANRLIGGSPKSRLWVRIREKEGLSYAVQSAFIAGATENFGRFIAVAIANPANMPKVESSFKDEMAKIISGGFAPDEIDTMKKEFMQEEQVGRAEDRGLVNELARNARYGWTMARDAEIESKIAALTPDELSAAVKRHIDPAGFIIIKAGDFKKAGVAQ
jgi:zinc protease